MHIIFNLHISLPSVLHRYSLKGLLTLGLSLPKEYFCLGRLVQAKHSVPALLRTGPMPASSGWLDRNWCRSTWERWEQILDGVQWFADFQLWGLNTIVGTMDEGTCTVGEELSSKSLQIRWLVTRPEVFCRQWDGFCSAELNLWFGRTLGLGFYSQVCHLFSLGPEVNNFISTSEFKSSNLSLLQKLL